MGKNGIPQQRDHIIMPKATLKRYMGRYDKVYYIDLNKIHMDNIDKINSKFPDAYNIERNYYDPQYDFEVKKVETEIGKLYKKIYDCHSNKIPLDINPDVLRNKIIKFTTMQYHRSVIADDTLLNKYRRQQQNENNEIDSILIRNGMISKERCEYSINFREKAASLPGFRYYAQNILGTENKMIQNLYKNFVPIVLFAPEKSRNSFLLPPMHFVGNEFFLHFILSPNISLTLYPNCPDGKYNSCVQIIDACERKINYINLRTLESAVSLNGNYKKIVGLEQQLNCLINKINMIKCVVKYEKECLCCESTSFILKDLDDVFEFAIILFFLYANDTELVNLNMRKYNFSHNIMEHNFNEIQRLFKKYMLKLIVK